jgi:hypothetical protein
MMFGKCSTIRGMLSALCISLVFKDNFLRQWTYLLLLCSLSTNIISLYLKKKCIYTFMVNNYIVWNMTFLLSALLTSQTMPPLFLSGYRNSLLTDHFCYHSCPFAIYLQHKGHFTVSVHFYKFSSVFPNDQEQTSKS